LADATIIATTLGTAAITGAVGTWAGLQQARTARAQLKAENERFRTQFSDSLRKERRETYEQLLNGTHELGLIGGNYRPAEMSDVDRWLQAFQAHLHSVALVGGPSVLGAVEALDGHLFEILRAYRDAGDAVPSSKRFNEAYLSKKALIEEDYQELLAAMRTDLNQEDAPAAT
jgi:hypothetical protein